MKTINVKELADLHSKNPSLDLIDVRTPVEFDEVHVGFAKNFPLDQLNPREFLASRNGNAGQPVYVICRSGKRSAMAAERIQSAGFGNVINVEGGTTAAVQCGLPVVRGRKAMSLERQVRIAAGSLVVTGVVLGWLIHPAFHGLAAFIGAGLVFAGVTDTCGMGMMIARLPWNQRKSCNAIK